MSIWDPSMDVYYDHRSVFFLVTQVDSHNKIIQQEFVTGSSIGICFDLKPSQVSNLVSTRSLSLDDHYFTCTPFPVKL